MGATCTENGQRQTDRQTATLNYEMSTMWGDSSVGIATELQAGRSGIESKWRRDFSQPSRPALWPTQPTVQWVPGLSRG